MFGVAGRLGWGLDESGCVRVLVVVTATPPQQHDSSLEIGAIEIPIEPPRVAPKIPTGCKIDTCGDPSPAHPTLPGVLPTGGVS